MSNDVFVNAARQFFLGGGEGGRERLVKMTFGLVYSSYSLPERYAVKLTFYSPVPFVSLSPRRVTPCLGSLIISALFTPSLSLFSPVRLSHPLSLRVLTLWPPWPCPFLLSAFLCSAYKEIGEILAYLTKKTAAWGGGANLKKKKQVMPRPRWLLHFILPGGYS